MTISGTRVSRLATTADGTDDQFAMRVTFVMTASRGVPFNLDGLAYAVGSYEVSLETIASAGPFPPRASGAGPAAIIPHAPRKPGGRGANGVSNLQSGERVAHGVVLSSRGDGALSPEPVESHLGVPAAVRRRPLRHLLDSTDRHRRVHGTDTG